MDILEDYLIRLLNEEGFYVDTRSFRLEKRDPKQNLQLKAVYESLGGMLEPFPVDSIKFNIVIDKTLSYLMIICTLTVIEIQR